MKKVLFILTLLVSVVASGQIQKMEVIGLDTLTTAERNALTVPGDRAYIIYNETTGQFEYSAKGGAWQTLGGGGGGLTDMDWADPIDANLLPDADGTRNLGSSAFSFGDGWFDGALTVGGSEVVTAASAFGTDNRLIRSDGTGKGVQSSGATLTDTGNLTITGNFVAEKIDIPGLTIRQGTTAFDVFLSPDGVLANEMWFDDSADTWKIGNDPIATSAGGTALENIVEDTTPQLGGDLDLNGFDIASTTSVNVNLDTDNNGAEDFNIVNGAGTTVFSVSEAGVVTGVDANEVVYDNVDSGLAATNVKAAIDEVVNDLQAQDAANEITYSNTTSGLAATNVQAAIDEVVAEINSNPINFVYNSGTGAYTVTTETTDDLIIIDRAADSNVLLPASPSAGASYTFQQAGAGKLQFPTSEYVTGTTLRTTGEGKVAQYLWDNTNSRWIAIGGLESYTPAGAPTIDGFESTATAGEVSSVAVNKPAAAASGKFAFILVWIEQTNLDTYFDNSTNKPTGFTQIGTQWGDINSDVFQAAYYKELDGTEGSSFTIPTPGTYTGNMGAVCFIVDGVNAANPIGQVGTAATDADYTPNPPIAGAVTTATNNELAIAFVGLDGSDLGSITGSGTGWTTQGTINDGQNSATGLSGIWAAAEIATAGTSNNYTVSTTSVDGYTAVQFTIRSE